MSTSAALLLAASGLLGVQETDRLRLDEAEDGLLRKWSEARKAADGPELLRLYDEACRRHAGRLVRPDPDSPLWIPLLRWLARELGELPSPSRERWELLAREMLDGPADPAARRDTAERYASTQAGRDVLFALANEAFDRGDPLAAMRGWSRLLDFGPSPALIARLAHAHAVAGDAAGLAALRARADAERWSGDVAVAGALFPLREILARAPATLPAEPASRPAPTGELALGRWDFTADGRAYRSGHAAMVPAWGTVDGRDAVFVTNGVRVVAFDPRAADGGSLEAGVLWRHPADGQVRPHGLPWSSHRPAARPLCGVTVEGGRLYALLLSRLPRNSHIQLGHRGNRDSFEGPSVIRALDAATGTVIWDTEAGEGDPDTDPPTGLRAEPFGRNNFAFTAPPLVRGDRLYAAVLTSPSSDHRCYVTCLRASDGAPLWTRFVASTRRSREAVSMAAIEESGGTLVVSTNFGVVAALETATGRIEWAVQYENLHAGLRPAPSAPCITPGAVYVLTQDAEGLLAFDRWSGRPHPMPSMDLAWEEVETLVGPAGDWLVLSGRTNAAVRPSDGRIARLAPEDSPRPGRGAIAGGRLYLPGRQGLGVYDTSTWKLLEAVPWPEGAGGGNVAVSASLCAILGDQLELYASAASFRPLLPPGGESHLRMGKILERSGRLTEAVDEYARGLDGAGSADSPTSAELRARLAELREKTNP